MNLIHLSACVILKDKTVLLLWREKYSHYEFPGGKAEAGESYEATTIRETKEETGCDVEIKKYLGYKDFEFKGKKYRSHKYLAEIKNSQEPGIVEKEIFTHFQWIPIVGYKKHRVAPNVKDFFEDVINNKIILLP
ncbi:NUDIX domain-containing protein [Candidatus Woesearchaeota archaeon]|nr:NUDIX domain-containing protein [Candidatus Woesearchaeota archaeon]